MVEKTVIFSEKAPPALGPYNVAIRVGDLVFTAGQLGLDPKTGELVTGGVEVEAQQAMKNLANVLDAADSSLDLAVKTTIFLRDMNDFATVNKVYGSFFHAAYPARSTVQVAALPKGGAVEIEVVAVVKSNL
jgi:2-iminobutanoate/2-iminopropanoate deaminase